MFGKSKTRRRIENAKGINWKKGDIYFIVYNKDLLLRYNLDMMHLEKKSVQQGIWDFTRHKGKK